MNKFKLACIIPVKPTLPQELISKSFELASHIPQANPFFDISIIFDFLPGYSDVQIKTPWSKVTDIRNRIVKRYNLPDKFQYVAWIDADIVDYSPDIITKLINNNDSGPSAPMVFVEGTERFYDCAAFVIKDKSDIEPDNPQFISGRNLLHDAPYWPEKPENNLVEMDCVGTFYTIPTWIYNKVEHTDHPSFTDHWEICKGFRVAGNKILVDTNLKVSHADLPKYGLSWN